MNMNKKQIFKDEINYILPALLLTESIDGKG